MQTQATGTNANGIVTGFWSDTNLGSGDNNFGFIRLPRKHGSYEYVSVNDPLVGRAPLVDQVLGINKTNNAVGFYNDANGASHAFAFLLANNSFAPITVQNAVSAVATGINDSNPICGSSTNPNKVTLGFVKPETSCMIGVTRAAAPIM